MRTTLGSGVAAVAAIAVSSSLHACAGRPLSGGIGYARMPVAEMRPPNVAVSENGAVCFVSAERFAKLKVGENLWCRWETPAFPVPSSPTP